LAGSANDQLINKEAIGNSRGSRNWYFHNYCGSESAKIRIFFPPDKQHYSNRYLPTRMRMDLLPRKYHWDLKQYHRNPNGNTTLKQDQWHIVRVR
jgi:hypothetical protein